jgi:hypothetical protein
VQVAYFDVGKHCSNPRPRVRLNQEFRPAICVKRRVVMGLEPRQVCKVSSRANKILYPLHLKPRSRRRFSDTTFGLCGISLPSGLRQRVRHCHPEDRNNLNLRWRRRRVLVCAGVQRNGAKQTPCRDATRSSASLRRRSRLQADPEGGRSMHIGSSPNHESAVGLSTPAHAASPHYKVTGLFNKVETRSMPVLLVPSQAFFSYGAGDSET